MKKVLKRVLLSPVMLLALVFALLCLVAGSYLYSPVEWIVTGHINFEKNPVFKVGFGAVEEFNHICQ